MAGRFPLDPDVSSWLLMVYPFSLFDVCFWVFLVCSWFSWFISVSGSLEATSSLDPFDRCVFHGVLFVFSVASVSGSRRACFRIFLGSATDILCYYKGSTYMFVCPCFDAARSYFRMSTIISRRILAQSSNCGFQHQFALPAMAPKARNMMRVAGELEDLGGGDAIIRLSKVSLAALEPPSSAPVAAASSLEGGSSMDHLHKAAISRTPPTADEVLTLIENGTWGISACRTRITTQNIQIQPFNTHTHTSTHTHTRQHTHTHRMNIYL